MRRAKIRAGFVRKQKPPFIGGIENRQLFLLLRENGHQNENDHHQRSENVEISHNGCEIIIHKNYPLINSRLKYQDAKDSTAPQRINCPSIVPTTSGPIKSEAKNTCPISRNISDNILSFGEEFSIASKLYHFQKSCQFRL